MKREEEERRKGVMKKVGIDKFVDKKRKGKEMNEKESEENVVKRVSFEGEEWIYFKEIEKKVEIIREKKEDERGKIKYENEGENIGGMDKEMDERKNGGIVIEKVKRIEREGKMKKNDVSVKGVMVDYIVVDKEKKKKKKKI